MGAKGLGEFYVCTFGIWGEIYIHTHIYIIYLGTSSSMKATIDLLDHQLVV